MQNENLLNPEAPPESERASRKKAMMFGVQGIAFLLGLSLLIFVFYKIGAEKVFESVSRVGWGFLLIIALNVSRHLMRAASMYMAVPREHRNFSYWGAVAARFGGDAVTIFSFAGPFLGDATKAVLLKKHVGLTHGASAVISDNILYYVSVILVILTGVVTLLFTIGSENSVLNRVLLAIVIGAVLIFTGIVLAMVFKVTPLSHLIDVLERRGIAPKFLIKKRKGILDVENNVFQFSHTRPGDFFKVFAISMSVHTISVAEVYAVLTFLDVEAVVNKAFIIESLTKVINASFSFIPGTIGVYEGGNGLILKTLGYGTAVGVALALVRRGAMLFSTLIGLTILLWRAAERGRRHLSKP